jgi:hypothetical protein
MTSFATDVSILFSHRDEACMAAQGVDLASYAYMSNAAGDGTFPDHANVRHVLARLSGAEKPQMPLGAPAWPAAKIAIVESWITSGFLP